MAKYIVSANIAEGSVSMTELLDSQSYNKSDYYDIIYYNGPCYEEAQRIFKEQKKKMKKIRKSMGF